MVIKALNGQRRPDLLEELRGASAGRSDIVILDQDMSADEMSSFLSNCDCYVSLHRAEGFGLSLAEAMAWGKPVIATGYSGNTDFMNAANSYLVPFQAGTVPFDSGPYPAGSIWAEPDLGAAAELMREVWEHRSVAAQRGTRGQSDIRRTHSLTTAVAVVRNRVNFAGRVLEEAARLNIWSQPVSKIHLPLNKEGLQAELRLNLGCGDDRRPGYLNIDLRADVADVVASVDRLPFRSGAASEIVGFDILEHLPASETQRVLQEWKRLLQPDGTLTVKVPNMLELSSQILAGNRVKDMIRNVYGGHRFGPEGAWDAHHTGWTPVSFAQELEQAGLLVVVNDHGLNMTVHATVLRRDNLVPVLAQVTNLALEEADALLDDLYNRWPEELAVLAAAARVAGKLPTARALTWSARLRQRGLASACPLLEVARNTALSAKARALAAATALGAFGEAAAEDLLHQTLADLDAMERSAILETVSALCPSAGIQA